MGRKPKAGGAKSKTTDPEQFARFLEAAREAGASEDPKDFERVFEKIIRPKPSVPRPKAARRSPDDA